MLVTYYRDPNKPYPFTEAELAAIDAAAERGENDPNSGYYDDCPELDEEFFRTAKRVYPQPFGKTRVTVRLDTDVLLWLKSYGNRYQTRLNSLLRLAMQADKKMPLKD
jgi:uncharacterized protein (DUF4415 family)